VSALFVFKILWKPLIASSYLKSIVMQTNSILSAELIDIIFAGRNKAYGAYELRKTYPQRIKKSLAVLIAIMGVTIGSAALAGSFKKDERPVIKTTSVDLVEIKDKPKPEVKELEQPKQQEPQVKTEKFIAQMVIKPDEEVKDPPPPQDDLKNAAIDDFKREGVDDDNLVDAPKEIDNGKKIIEEKITKEEDEGPLEIVQVHAKYDGNWIRFLEKNLNPEVPVENSAPAGRYTVQIRFVVDKEGNISNVEALTNNGYGMEAEAIRVIKKSTRWEPAIQGGYSVKAYHTQPIIFEVIGEM
jgi:periplasmic protein TonB